MSRAFIFGRVLGTIWLVIDGFRKLLHLFLLLLLVPLILLIVVAAVSRPGPNVPASTALVLAPQGTLVDQLSGSPLSRALAVAQGTGAPETALRDLVNAVRAAKGDARIKTLVLDLDALTASGLSKLQELAEEIDSFRESGKPVIAVGDGFERDQYYLASRADEIWMHPMGSVLIDGYSRFLPYYKEALDKLYIDYNVWTVGEFKSFVEPATRNDMSPEDREASLQYLTALWGDYQADVTAARELPGDALQRYADGIAGLLRGADGDMARLALEYGLVDELVHRNDVRERLREQVGAAEHAEPGLSHQAYLAAINAGGGAAAAGSSRSRVAVVVLSGTILDGRQPPGSIGGDSAAQQIRNAARNDRVKALVLRVDSPGGSAFASEIILREVLAFQESGRPVVVSMGSTAASGGYWISMSADEIWASPTTLTGSIGVGATLPTFQRTLGWAGVNIDGVGTTELAGQADLLRGLGDDFRDVIGQTVVATYAQFIGQVAEHRERPEDEIDRVARGRVWTGRVAVEHGLVDRLGDLDDAIASAAGLAGLEEGRYRIDFMEPELGFAERLAIGLVHSTGPALAAARASMWPGSLERLAAQLDRQFDAPLEFGASLNDPRNLYAYCFCDVR